MTKELKDCFVISPIGESDSTTRKRSDKVLKHIITPSVSSFDYKPIRADQISEPGIITTQVIQYIVEAPLVIADLTDRNPNVFYELAIRHAIKKPLIQLIKKGEAIPFDVAATRIVHFDIQDLDSVEEAKEEISNQIKNLHEGDGECDNPISISLELKILKESGNPEQMSLADLLSVITELRSNILSIDKRISDPSNIIPPEYFDKVFRKISRRNLNPDVFYLIDRHIHELRELIDRYNHLYKIQMDSKQIRGDIGIEYREFGERLKMMYERLKMTFMEMRDMM